MMRRIGTFHFSRLEPAWDRVSRAAHNERQSFVTTSIVAYRRLRRRLVLSESMSVISSRRNHLFINIAPLSRFLLLRMKFMSRTLFTRGLIRESPYEMETDVFFQLRVERGGLSPP